MDSSKQDNSETRSEDSDYSTSTMSSNLVGTVFTVLADVSIWLCVGVFVSLQAFDKLGIPPVDTGFYCDDQAIRYPYRPETVSNLMLVAAGAIIPAVIMVLVEAGHVLNSKTRIAKGLKYVCRKYIVAMYRTLGVYLSGVVGTLLITEVLKTSSGRLRPYFMDVCKPNMTSVNCDKGFISVSELQCLGTDTALIIDARKSFPSGHASLMAYAAVYLVVFLQIRFTWRRITLLVPTLQVTAISATCFISITRVTDHKHHASDVVGGIIIGAIIALVVVKYMSHLFKNKQNGADKYPDPTDPTSVKDSSGPHTVMELNHL